MHTDDQCRIDGCSATCAALERQSDGVALYGTARGGVGLCLAHEQELTAKLSARNQFVSNTRSDRRAAVYAARCGSHIKIGRSSEPERRCRALGADTWLVVWGENEGELQLRFWDQHSHGEYFHDEGEIRRWYNELLEKADTVGVRLRRGHILSAAVHQREAGPLCGNAARQRPLSDPDSMGTVADAACDECLAIVKTTDRELLANALWLMR